MSDRPAPLVPPAVDLRGYEFMPFYGHHLLGSTFHAQSSDAAWRAGVTLWWAAWNQVPAASLPNDDKALCRLADLGLNLRAWRKVKTWALHGFVECSDGRLYHPFIAPLALKAWAKILRRRARFDRRLMMESGEWAAIRALVFKRDNFTCRYCADHTGRLECDHVIPISRGGTTTMENLVTACLPCNRSKGARTPEEWKQ